MSAERIEGDFYAAQKLPLLLLLQGSKVMQKTADILPGTKCQCKKQSGRGTEELIYTQEGDFTCQSFSWGRSLHI